MGEARHFSFLQGPQMPSTGPKRIALQICFFRGGGGGRWSFHTQHTVHTVATGPERILHLMVRCPGPLILLDLPLQQQIPEAMRSFALCLGTRRPLRFFPGVASGLPVKVPCCRPSHLPEGSRDPLLGERRYLQVRCLLTSHLMVIYEF